MPVNCRNLLFLSLIATHIVAIKSKQIPPRASIAAVGGTNLQDLQDFCRVSGKENKNVNCTNMFGLLESFVDALRAEIFQKSNSNFSN